MEEVGHGGQISLLRQALGGVEIEALDAVHALHHQDRGAGVAASGATTYIGIGPSGVAMETK